MCDDELTPSEKQALEALRRDKPPSEFLVERVVRALRVRGVLEGRRRWFLEVTSLRIAGAVAACIVLLIGGFTLGRLSDSLGSSSAGALASKTSETSVAASLQRAGTAYVLALDTLASMPETAPGDEVRQGREVALVTLYTAAGQMARIVPRDLLARQLVLAVEAEEGAPAGGRAQAHVSRVVWF